MVEGSLEVKLLTIWTDIKSRGGKSQRRERGRRKKMQVREKVEKSRNTVFFQCFVALEGRKVGLLKRRVQSHLGRWEMKNCTPLWREEELEAKQLKAPHVRSTFGSWDVEKVHGPVARSTFWSQNGQNTTCSEHFWKLRCWKSARRCGTKHISKPKCTKHTNVGALLEVEMMKKCRSLWHESYFKVKMPKTHNMPGPLLDVQGRFFVAGARYSSRVGFVGVSETMAGVGHLKRICKDAFRMAGAVQETSPSDMLGGQGADFLRRVVFWKMRSSGLLRWFCVTGAARRMTWHHFFVASAVL